MADQTVLATLPDSSSTRRLQILLVRSHDGRIGFSLREQHYSARIGWFDQRVLELDPRQWQQLQGFLGRGGPSSDSSEIEPPALIPFPGSSSGRAGGEGSNPSDRAGRGDDCPFRIFRGPASRRRPVRVGETGSKRKQRFQRPGILQL
jgi:hypothetical protein